MPSTPLGSRAAALIRSLITLIIVTVVLPVSLAHGQRASVRRPPSVARRARHHPAGGSSGLPDRRHRAADRGHHCRRRDPWLADARRGWRSLLFVITVVAETGPHDPPRRHRLPRRFVGCAGRSAVPGRVAAGLSGRAPDVRLAGRRRLAGFRSRTDRADRGADVHILESTALGPHLMCHRRHRRHSRPDCPWQRQPTIRRGGR